MTWYAASSGGAAGYLQSLEKMELLDIDFILPSHGEIMTDGKGAIQRTREKIMEKDHEIIKAHAEGAKSFKKLPE